MPINMTIAIRNSVGSRGRNDAADVRLVQTRLNELMHPPRVKLTVDGRSGPKTEAMIRDFQKNVSGLRAPDGRVDPMGKTLAALNDPASEGKWARMSIGAPAAPAPPGRPGAAGEAEAGLALIEEEARKQGKQNSFNELRRSVIDGAFPPLKSLIGAVKTAEDARQMLAAWKAIRDIGFTPLEAAQWLGELKKKYPERTADFIKDVSRPGSRMVAGLRQASRLGNRVAVALLLIEVADKFEQGDYLYGTSELYKFVMGTRVPWAGLIDALQGIAGGLMPETAKSRMVFKVLHACDPIGLGGVGVDTVGTLAIGLVEMVVKGRMDPGRLDRLVDRMKSGPTRFFAEMGENLGDAVFEMSLWTRDDWSYAVRAIPGFVAYLFGREP